MFLRFFIIIALAAVGVSTAAPVEAPNGLSSVVLENALAGAALAYHGVGEAVGIAGPDGQKGAAVLSSYGAIVSNGGALPPPGNQTVFSKAVQFALCNAETTGINQGYTG